MKIVYCLMLLLCPLLIVAQTSALKPLRIGDKVPAVNFSQVLNAAYKTSSLASFSGKLILIDFWATWCVSCIREFPKLDSLQQQFNDRIQILLVNNLGSGDDEKKITSFFEKKRNARGGRFSMPVIVNDSLLHGWFPHLTIPHTVWINDGKVIAVTEAEEVTASNILAVLNNRTVSMVSKEDQLDFAKHKPLIENGNGGTSIDILYKSMFTKYLKGAGGAMGQSKSDDGVLRRKYYINFPLISLYYSAFPQLETNRVILDSQLTTEIICDTPNFAWRKAYCYCYEQTLPAIVNASEQQYFMQLDLDRQFGLYSRIEKRRIKCFVLKLNNQTLLKNSQADNVKNGIQKTDSGFLRLKNVPLKKLIDVLNRQPFGKTFCPVVLDETGYTNPVDLEIRLKDIHDLAALQKILPQYGLRLDESERDISMLIISKKIIYPTN